MMDRIAAWTVGIAATLAVLAILAGLAAEVYDRRRRRWVVTRSVFSSREVYEAFGRKLLDESDAPDPPGDPYLLAGWTEVERIVPSTERDP